MPFLINVFHFLLHIQLITPPARRAWRSFKFAPFLFFFRCQKSAQRSWVIPLNIAVLSPTFKVNFLAEYLTKTHILTCILQHLNSKKVLGAKILIQTIATNFDKFHSERAVNRSIVFLLKFPNIYRTINP